MHSYQRFRMWVTVLSLVALPCLFGAALFAQVDAGSIVGTIRDSTGAVIAGAKSHVTQ